MKLGKLIKLRNLTKKSFCEATGISKSALHNYENDKNQPTLDVVISAANVLNCSLETIAGYNTENIIDKKMLSEEKQKLIDEILNLDPEKVPQVSAFIAGINISKK